MGLGPNCPIYCSIGSEFMKKSSVFYCSQNLEETPADLANPGMAGKKGLSHINAARG